MFWNNSEQEEHNYWISYTDLVMGLLMAFIVVSMVLFSRDSEKAALDGKYSELVTAFKEKFKDNEGIEVTDDATIPRTKRRRYSTSVRTERKLGSSFDYPSQRKTPETINRQ